MPPPSVCKESEVTEFPLNIKKPIEGSAGEVVFREYGVTIIGEATLIIDNEKFTGTVDKKWGFGITWRIGIGQDYGKDKHIIDLPVGLIKVNIDK